MNDTAVLERLTTNNVIERDNEGDGYRLTSSFVERIQVYVEDIEQFGDDLTERIGELVPARAPIPEDVEDLDPTVLAEYCAVMELAEDEADGIAIMALLDQFTDPPADEGGPSAFLPVRGQRLPFLLPGYDAAIVYIWRDDCPPCDVMKGHFESLFESPPSDLFLVSVYGPQCPVLLDERFDVVGAPTTLFVRDGAVDSRYFGAKDRQVIESEIETVRRLSRE